MVHPVLPHAEESMELFFSLFAKEEKEKEIMTPHVAETPQVTRIPVNGLADGMIIALLAPNNGKFVSRVQNVICGSPSLQLVQPIKDPPDKFCWFTVNVIGNKIALQADTGLYVSHTSRKVTCGKDVYTLETLEATKQKPDEYCQFSVEWETQHGSKLTLKVGKFYVSYTRRQLGGTWYDLLEANKTSPDATCNFYVSTEPCDNFPQDSMWQEVQKRVTDCQTCLKTHTEKECIEHIKPGCRGVDTKHSRSEWVLMGVDTPSDQPVDNFVLFAADRHIPGIECESLWEKSEPDYWTYAWREALDLTYSKRYSNPEGIGLALDAWGDPARPCRTSNQLHIHMCGIHTHVQPRIEQVEKTPTTLENVATWPDHWKDSCVKLPDSNGKPYRVLILNPGSDSLRYEYQKGEYWNLFQLLWYSILQKDKNDGMRNQSLVVCQRPKNLGGGFYIINGTHLQGAGVGIDLFWSTDKKNCQ